MPPRAPTSAVESTEIITSLPSHDALIQSQIQALRSMSDQMAQMGRVVERLANDVQTTRDGVVRLEAQDLKATILALRTEALGAVDKLRVDHDADIDALRREVNADVKEVAGKAEVNSRSISFMRGVLLPLSVFGSAALTGLVTWLATVFGTGHH